MITNLSQKITDIILEIRIFLAAQSVRNQKNPSDSWQKMKSLIAQRSPEFVAKMERERGIL